MYCTRRHDCTMVSSPSQLNDMVDVASLVIRIMQPCRADAAQSGAVEAAIRTRTQRAGHGRCQLTTDATPQHRAVSIAGASHRLPGVAAAAAAASHDGRRRRATAAVARHELLEGQTPRNR
jgi:hypothetical protein